MRVGYCYLPSITDLVAGAESGCRRSEEHTSELQSRLHLVCRLLLEKKKHALPPRSLCLNSALPAPSPPNRASAHRPCLLSALALCPVCCGIHRRAASYSLLSLSFSP